MKISGIFFAIVLLAFLLPFLVVTCQDQKVATISGYKAAFGGNVRTAELEDQVNDLNKGLKGLQDLAENLGDTEGEVTPDEEKMENVEQETQKMKASFWGILALLAALAGLITALILDKKSYILPLVAAVIGFLALLFLPGSVKNQVLGSAQGMTGIKVSTQFGYWLSLLSFIVAGVLAFLAGRNKPVLSSEQVSKVIPDRVEHAFDKAKDSISTAGAGVAGAVGGAYDKVKDTVEKANLDEKFDKMVDGAKDKFADVKDKVQDTVEKANLDEKFDRVVEGAKDKFEDVKDKVANAVDKADEKLDQVVDDAKGKIADAADKVKDSVEPEDKV